MSRFARQRRDVALVVSPDSMIKPCVASSRKDVKVRLIRDFHHYRLDELLDSDRVSNLERRVVDILLTSVKGDSERESSIAFELKHSSSVTQFARLIGQKRGLDEDLCAAGAVLHDIYVIVEGKYKDHARLGEPIAHELMVDSGFTGHEEKKVVTDIVVNHSDKHIWTSDPYAEFGKDIDVLDCFLYPNAVEFYIKNT